MKTESIYGRLYLIPTPLGENEPSEVLPSYVIDKALSLKCFVVEELRTARRFLSRIGLKGHIDELEFHVLNEHSSFEEAEKLGILFKNGQDVGLLSEAGLPAVADPGAMLVEICHRKGVEVCPLSGPSSLMMALMASGLNGQSFAFRGYLPAKTDERRKAIKSMERISLSDRQTEIFIETPYRNDSFMKDLVEICSPKTRICVAINISMPDQWIKTLSAAEWKKALPEIGKRPCVFLMLAK